MHEPPTNGFDQSLYFSIISQIEASYPVAEWRVGDIPIWPLARIGLRFDMLREVISAVGTCEMRRSYFRRATEAMMRTIDAIGAPLSSLWRNRSDLRHEIFVLGKRDAVFLSNGFSADFIEGTWHDRYCAPVMSELDRVDRSSVLLNPSLRQRLPRDAPTFSAYWIERLGRLVARASSGIFDLEVHLPNHTDVMELLRREGLPTEAFEKEKLERQARAINVIAGIFGLILRRTQPRLGFVVSYYWDMGHAFCLACRRNGVLSIDIQHGAQGGQHEAYNQWRAVPKEGYSILPALFWNWTAADAKAIDGPASKLRLPWHRSLFGGHPQLSRWLDDSDPVAVAFDRAINSLSQPGDVNILVALQDLDGYRHVWERLAEIVEASPVSWRWWLRLHPVDTYNRGDSTARLQKIARPNVLVSQATSFPLPALLRNMDFVISLMSGASVEASFFGHTPIFLTEDARGLFSLMLDSGDATIVTDMKELVGLLSSGTCARPHRNKKKQPTLTEAMAAIDFIAQEYQKVVLPSSPETHLRRK